MGLRPRVLIGVAVVGLVLVGTGCSSGSPSASSASSDPTEPVSPDPAGDCPLTRPADVIAEQAAGCVRLGWATNDARLVEAYGTPGVTDPLPRVMAEVAMTAEGCVAGAAGETVCSWSIEHSDGVAIVRFHVTDVAPDGYRVTTTDATR